MNRKEKYIPSYRVIWGKIRYYQRVNELSDEQLASYLNLCVRTLKDYDKNAKNLTLDKLDNFLIVSKMDLSELITL